MKKLIHAALMKFGYRIHKDPGPRPELQEFFNTIRKAGYTPKHIVDIGANHCVWTGTAVKYFPRAKYTLLEPQIKLKSYADALSQKGYDINFINCGAGDENRTMTFNVDEHDYSSTFQDRTGPSVVGQVQVPVRTLNDVIEREHLPIPNIIKIDAEGFDIKVIHGASNVIGTADFVLIESAMNVIGLENQMLFVLQLMDKLGYEPFTVTEICTGTVHRIGRMVELAFINRKSSCFDSFKEW